MKLPLSVLLLLCLAVPKICAQRDAPAWECYLPSTSIFHGTNDTVEIDLVFKKSGGPHEHMPASDVSHRLLEEG